MNDGYQHGILPVDIYISCVVRKGVIEELLCC